MTAKRSVSRSARTVRRFTGISAVATTLGAILFAVLPATYASAGTQPHGTVMRLAAPAGQRAEARVITCKILVTLRFPHPVTAIGVVKCSGRVPRIALKVRLFRNFLLIRHHVFTKGDVRTLKGVVSAPCRPGTYQARVNGAVRLRGGKILTGRAITRRIRVSC
jgi:hypothetical protein